MCTALAVMALILTALIVPVALHAQTEKMTVYLYWGEGCPHCEIVKQYIQDNRLDERYDIVSKEVYSNAQNAQELTSLFSQYRVPASDQGVPFAIINGHYFVGDSPIIAALNSPPSAIPSPAATNTAHEDTAPSASLNVWSVSGAALVDAINPCAFAVLVILMGTVLASGSRRRALVSGLTFTLAIYLSYLAMGLGLYSAVSAVGTTVWIQRIIGILAIVLGLFNIKDAIWYGKGFLMEVPMGWRPRLKQLIQSVTNPLIAFAVGIVVSIFLLPCTSGPYIVIIGMLGTSATFPKAVQWLVYYNLIFILPMIAITLAVYYGLKPERLEAIRQRRLRLLHAVAGIILLSLGIYLLI